MPLVTITCSQKFYPPDDGFADTTAEQAAITDLVDELPNLIAGNALALGLNPEETPTTGVQVDIKKFHVYAINRPDVWIRIEFVEADLSEEQRLSMRDVLITILGPRIADFSADGCSWALDVFFGPGHGCYTNDDGVIQLKW